MAVPAVYSWSSTAVPSAKARGVASGGSGGSAPASASVMLVEPLVRPSAVPVSVIVSLPSSSLSAVGSIRNVREPEVEPAGMTRSYLINSLVVLS